ncbi:hypothetical protein SAMN03159423_2962 [Bradyrhizobium sp. NFR13]|jgi:hypothetical protein|uniref:hypothetical protein n=1 Tax=Bradyrhizobium sp. NFR13 TaxID=1566285 RepID=UPI0008EDD367|nr:hypothetical protein [Bradyrhizobium sp. NFR13]SFL63155.1 hypothetical protein SAMN03159423_2962 [Bradyrhizobium sp. NFR13]
MKHDFHGHPLAQSSMPLPAFLIAKKELHKNKILGWYLNNRVGVRGKHRLFPKMVS